MMSLKILINITVICKGCLEICDNVTLISAILDQELILCSYFVLVGAKLFKNSLRIRYFKWDRALDCSSGKYASIHRYDVIL